MGIPEPFDVRSLSLGEAILHVQIQHVVATGEVLDRFSGTPSTCEMAALSAGRSLLVRGRHPFGEAPWPDGAHLAIPTVVGPVALIADPDATEGHARMTNGRGAERHLLTYT